MRWNIGSCSFMGGMSELCIDLMNKEREKNMDRNKKCKDLVQSAFESRMDDIRRLYEAGDDGIDDIGTLWEYGLSIDKVEAGTFSDQRASYIRYQLSWGGPSEEFRIYDNGDVEFWYLDWFDGACVDVVGSDADLIRELVGFAWG